MSVSKKITLECHECKVNFIRDEVTHLYNLSKNPKYVPHCTKECYVKYAKRTEPDYGN